VLVERDDIDTLLDRLAQSDAGFHWALPLSARAVPASGARVISSIGSRIQRA
jgi:hypothetical protein